MKDFYGRDIDYLRISLTPNCNLRCLYCMPKSGIKLPDESLNDEELLYLVKLICKTGIKKIRLTGGEPLLRPKIADLIFKIKSFSDVEEISLTTNGILLENFAQDLVLAGIDSINLSLDTIDENLFKKITRGGDIDKVFLGINAVKKLNIPLKLNSVILKHIDKVNTKEQILSLVKFADEESLPIRFIELMPLNVASKYVGVSEAEIKTILKHNFGKLKLIKEDKSPAHYYEVENLSVPIGFISALSHNFCSSCNRLRLTFDGILKPCLHHLTGFDLKQLMRKKISDDEIIKAIENVIYHKPQRHHLKEKNFSLAENHSMSLIGG